MGEMARLIIGLGFLMIIMGVLLLLFERLPGMGKLPGDILIKKENFTFYFPLTTCLLISLVMSLIFLLSHRK